MHVIRTSQGEPPAQEPEALSLFVVPHSASTAFIWCSQLEGATISAIRMAVGPVSILERKKLVRPGHTLEVLFIDGVNLRDGTVCELHVTGIDNGLVSTRASACLARWGSPDTSRALKLIATRFTSDRGLPVMLEQYLAFVSAWQAPSRVLATFSEGAIVEIDVDVVDDKVTAYTVTTQGLCNTTIQPLLQSSGKLIVWISDLTVQRLYLELPGALIRVNLDGANRSQAGTQPINGVALKQRLVTAIHRVVTNPSQELADWAAAQCTPTATIRHEDTTIDVRRVVRLASQDVVVLMEVAGAAAELEQFQLNTFGARSDLTIEVVTRDADSGGQQIILRAVAPGCEAGCYQLSWVCAGRPNSIWMRETDSCHPINVTLARDFMRVALVDAKIFRDVLHPLATAPDRPSAPGLVQVTQLGIPNAAPCADIFVFAGGDLEALHRTILGLSLTSRETVFQVQVCVLDPGVIDELVVAAEKWSRTYHIALKVACYSARTSEAQVVSHVFRSDRPRIFCRAGAVPRCSDWLSRVLKTLRRQGATLLFANTASLNMPGPKSAPVIPISALLSSDTLPWAERLVAAVVPPHSDPVYAPIPRVHTLEAFLLAHGLQGSDGEASLRLAPDAIFVHSGSDQRTDEFYARLDVYSLQQARTASLASKRQTRHHLSRMTA